MLGFGTIAGAALGGLGGLFGGGGGPRLSAADQAWLDRMRRMALSFASQQWAPDPSLSQVQGGLLGYLGQGQAALGGLLGDRAVLAQAMRPGQDLIGQSFDFAYNRGLQDVKRATTLGGGLNSLRAGIPIADFATQIGAARAQALQGLLGQVYSNFGQAAGLGLGAAGQAAGIGQFLTDLPMRQALAKLGLLGQAMGPMLPQAGGGGLGGGLLGLLGGAVIGQGLEQRKTKATANTVG